MTIAKPVAAILLAGALAGTVAGVRAARGVGRPALGEEARIQGSRSASLSVVEYFDYQCGACRTAYLLFREYERAFPGSIRIEMRYYPLPGHPFGLKAAIFADCAAAQGRFWPFHDRMMEHQQHWSRFADPTGSFRGYAGEAGADLAKLDACVADPETEIRVLKEKEKAVSMGVKLTPTALMNGEFVAGANAIRDKLKQMFGEVKAADASNPPAGPH